MNVLQRNAAHLNLTPAERAVLRLLEGFLFAGVIAVLPVIAQALGQQSINWQVVAQTAAGAFLVAVLAAAAKFYKAQGDPPLSSVLDAAAQNVAHRAGLNDVKTGVILPHG